MCALPATTHSLTSYRVITHTGRRSDCSLFLIPAISGSTAACPLVCVTTDDSNSVIAF